MVNRVEGYMASDGTFHLTEAEAELHEATHELSDLLTHHRISAERFIEVARVTHTELMRFLNAYEAYLTHTPREQSDEPSGEAAIDPTATKPTATSWPRRTELANDRHEANERERALAADLEQLAP